MSELDGICHEKHEPINIDSEVRDQLRAFLQHEAPKGMGYTAFIQWALREASLAVTPCELDGYGQCDVHFAALAGDSPDVDEEGAYCEEFGISYP